MNTVLLAAALGLSCIALAVWLIRDEIRRQNPDRHAASRCPGVTATCRGCGWESAPQPTVAAARHDYDRHVIAELERIS